MDSPRPPAGRPPSRFAALAAGMAPLLSLTALALHLAVMTCFAGRWDKTAAITIIPIWVWSLLGLVIAGVAWLCARGRFAGFVCALWTVTLLVCPDEWRGIWRAAVTRTDPPPHPSVAAKNPARLRVITLNCRARNFLSAREAATWKPDILLLQEMRGGLGGPLAALAHELWGPKGSVVFGADTVILARGQLVPSARTPPGQGQQFIQATLKLDDGREIEVASVHLQGHVTDLRLWNWRTWRAHAQNQKNHRLYVADVMLRSLAAAEDRACLIGGDFNSPAGDRTFQTLRPRFRDAFAEAGVGWGNTFRNDWPILRIDQVWATHELVPASARTVASAHSDHRFVVVDYEWR